MTASTFAFWPGVASAKEEPTAVTIEGDGFAPVRVEVDDSTPRSFSDLFQQTHNGEWTTAAPTQNLGRKLTVTWELSSSNTTWQLLYPDAEGGPLVYQPRQGWYDAPDALVWSLRGLGVPDAPARPVAPAPGPTPDGGLSVAPLALVAGMVVLGLLAAGLIAARRLNRRPRLAT